MKKSENITLSIDRLDTDGIGMGDLDGIAVKVAGTVPGDIVRAVITQIKRTSGKGKLLQIESPGIERSEPICPHFGICGGCRWQNIPYPDQLTMKAGMLARALAGIEGYRCPENIRVIASSDITHYRNKMEFSFDQKPESGFFTLGLHEAGRFNSVFDVTGCVLQSERSNRIVAETRNYFLALGAPAYGMKSHRGLLRYLVIREGKATGETMVNLVTSGEEFPDPDKFISHLAEAIPEISTILLTINCSASGVAFGGERRVMAGEGCIHDLVGRNTYAISPDSFFQTNTAQAQNLYETIGEFCGLTGAERVLDLYCGTGTIGISVAGRAGSVLGIEISEEAVRDAVTNAALNRVENIELVSGKAEEIAIEGMGPFDVVICDPPRPGIHPRAMDQLVRMRAPRMVYVSCNPAALPNDLTVLMLAGYRIRDIRAFDMSPHTPHIETVAQLEL